MRRILIAAAATMTFGAAAWAQESPAILYDDAYGNVTNQDGEPADYGASADYGVDYGTTSSVVVEPTQGPGYVQDDPTASANYDGTANINLNDNYSGK